MELIVRNKLIMEYCDNCIMQHGLSDFPDAYTCEDCQQIVLIKDQKTYSYVDTEKLIAQIDAVKEMIDNIYFGRCNSLYHTEHRDIIDRLDEIKNELSGKE